MIDFVDFLVFASIVGILYWIVSSATKRKGKDVDLFKQIGIPLIVVGLLVFGVRECINSSEPITLSMEERVYYQAQDFIKDNLKSPSTAEFPYYKSNDVMIVTMPDDKNTYAVKAWVDAKNSFGVPIRMKYLIHLKHLDTHWRMESLVIDGEKVY